MEPRIPAPLIAALARFLSDSYSHDSLDRLFEYAEAPGSPREGSKFVKVQVWLRRVNGDEGVDPLNVLARLIEDYMEIVRRDDPIVAANAETRRDTLTQFLAESSLRYLRGGRVVSDTGLPSRSLPQMIAQRDVPSIDEEFERALSNVDADPREAISAACNVLEAVCKTYIEDEGLQMPGKQDLQNVWNVARKDLGFDPSAVQDEDLQKILSGMISVVDGLGALRTHASSAHPTGTPPRTAGRSCRSHRCDVHARILEPQQGGEQAESPALISSRHSPVHRRTA